MYVQAYVSNSRKLIFDKLEILLKKKLNFLEAKYLSIFMKKYYASASEEDLNSRSISDLYGGLISQWNLLQKRKTKEANIKIYNPSFEESGWNSNRTIIEISYDDMPFIVDSILLYLNSIEVNIYVVFHVGGLLIYRNKVGNLLSLYQEQNISKNSFLFTETAISIEISKQNNPIILNKIKNNISNTLNNVDIIVSDFEKMKFFLEKTIKNLKYNYYNFPKKEILESVDFLKWLYNHFIFIGSGKFIRYKKQNKLSFQLVSSSNLGLLKKESFLNENIKEIEMLENISYDLLNPISIIKSNQISTIHRSSHFDIISVKNFSIKGEILGETRFIGLYTSMVYHNSCRYIPFLRRKVESVLFKSGFSQNGHDAKALINVLEKFPKDELFQINETELYQISIEILQIQERKKIKLFVRNDSYNRYYYCIIYFPKEKYNTNIRKKIQNILLNSFKGISSNYIPIFLESVLCRIDFIIKVDPNISNNIIYNIKDIELKIIEATYSWKDKFKKNLLKNRKKIKSLKLYKKYKDAFPLGYREFFSIEVIIDDIFKIENFLDKQKICFSFYQTLSDDNVNLIRFKMFHKNEILPLTKVLPVFGNMGLNIVDERTYKILPYNKKIWISDFGIKNDYSLSLIKERLIEFQDAFFNIWIGNAENDKLNFLVIQKRIKWRDIVIFRAYTKYLIQIGCSYSQKYIENAIIDHANIAKKLIKLFYIKFSPNFFNEFSFQEIKNYEKKICNLISQVSIIEYDKILRKFLNLFKSTVRTNFFQLDKNKNFKSYLSIKFDCTKIENFPEKRVIYAIFVYSPHIEAIHLRSAKISRGGLRWSDRHEDFHTEILGLMKAQHIKNSVIVPLGAKGGFICKKIKKASHKDFLLEGIYCYKIFISGLLDLTDNIIDGKIITPPNLKCFDDSDYYLVVAADKGTTTFSDIANNLAKKYNFWLGDAFASGGTYGYDHKKLGITAKGVWKSIERRFLEIGYDINSRDFTVVGIGDMSGDVFGNGMLLSNRIQLVAAFNHLHIFIDPNPDPLSSYKERERIFKLPRSSWKDYNANFISEGGGIFNRSDKLIPISMQMKKRFYITEKMLEPNKLIQFILKAKIDLIWNGGIGTYIKASYENNNDVEDRANDAIRISANQLRCLVIAEGGNLGLTQKGRIEYALKGGGIYIDAIDNSAGVDCSDHEVNIKIILKKAVEIGRISFIERNNLLEKMQDEVVQLVLSNNYAQTQIISRMSIDGKKEIGSFIRLIQKLEEKFYFNRITESLPSKKEMKIRKSTGKGLTTPEISVLLAYTKIMIKQELLKSKIYKDPYCKKFLKAEFPVILSEKFEDLMSKHILASEIIITTLTNFIIQRMGITFFNRMYDETGANSEEIAKSFIVVNELIQVDNIWFQIEKLEKNISYKAQKYMILEITKIKRKLCRWFLKNHKLKCSIQSSINSYKEKLNKIKIMIPNMLGKYDLETQNRYIQECKTQGIPTSLSLEIKNISYISYCLDIIETEKNFNIVLFELLEIFFLLNEIMSFSWIRNTLLKKKYNQEYWKTLAISSMRDDLDHLQCVIAKNISLLNKYNTSKKKIDKWIQINFSLVKRWNEMIELLKTNNSQNMVLLIMTFRSLLDLTN